MFVIQNIACVWIMFILCIECDAYDCDSLHIHKTLLTFMLILIDIDRNHWQQ